jgi:hypothetical protein
MIKKRLLRQNFDVFYDKDRVAKETNKNSNTGMMALQLFLDPTRNPANSGRSVLGDLAPAATHLIFSGDTGNGFRGIPMSWYYSTLHRQFGLTCEQIPLAPRHAFNPTDAHFAHLNCFYRKLMRVSYLCGPEEFAKALAMATSPKTTDQRKVIQRCTPVYHRFTVDDYIKPPDWLIKTRDGELSVSKLGYFLYSTTHPDGQEGAVFEEGLMRVRQYADQSAEDPLVVWDMRHPKQCCQICTDRKVLSATCSHVVHHVTTTPKRGSRCTPCHHHSFSPLQGRRVFLEENGCTPKVCGRTGETDDGSEEVEADEMKSDSDSEPLLQHSSNRRKRKKTAVIESSSSEEEFELRAEKIVKESWINPSKGYPQRVFVVEMNTGIKEKIVAEDRDDPVPDLELNVFYIEVIRAWRVHNDVPARPPPKAASARRKKRR